MKQRKFYQAMSRLADRDINVSQFQELENHLLTSEEARRQYREFFHLQSMTALEIDFNQGASKVVPINRIINRQKRRAIRLALISAVAVIVLTLAIMRIFLTPEVEHRQLAFDTSPGTQFSLTHDSDDDLPPAEEKSLRPGSRLKLSQGVVKLEFPSGIRSVIMAPADITLHSEEQLFVNEGRAWFHVPQEAVGFRVKTRDLDVVDLGTEFGVLASPGDHDQVHVFKGKVRATARRVRKQSEILSAGIARRIDPIGRLTSIRATSSAFLDTLPDTLPYLHWSFDHDESLQATGTHPYTTKTTTISRGAPEKLVDGPIGKALKLDPSNQHLRTNWEGFSGDRPRSVAFWIKLPYEGQPYGVSGILGWGDNSQKAGKWELLVQQASHQAGSLKLFWGQEFVSTKNVMKPGTWHHIVVTDTGKTSPQGVPEIKFYINARSVPLENPHQQRIPANIITDTKDAEPLTIGSSIRQDSLKHRRSFIRGEIDEIYIFDGALSDEQALLFSTKQLSLADIQPGSTKIK